MNVLVLNAGSSSQKSCLYRIDDSAPIPETPPEPLWKKHEEAHPDALEGLLRSLWEAKDAVIGGPEEIDAVGHRIVHGGQALREPTPITPEVKEAIRAMTPLAPEHNPAALEGIEAVTRLLGPSVPQLAVFDTAFHRTLPDAAAVYPGPYAWAEQGLRRYGFHGINHAWCAERAARLLAGRFAPDSLRLVSCHLGNGCSLAAIRGGRSVDTTMGFTPMEGLMMGTRSGSIDPGLLLYLLRQPGASVDALDHILNEESGLKGISGLSGDMRDIDAARAKNEKRARLAFDIYIHRLRAHIGAMVASLEGCDALVFTAGVGENSAPVREAACAGFAFLGVGLDEEKNKVASPDERDISRPDAPVRVLVIPAQEDWAIARECFRLHHA